MSESEKTPLLSQDFNDDDEDDDGVNIPMKTISSTTRPINPDDERERPITTPRTRIEETSFGGRDYESAGARPKSPKTIFSELEKNQDESGDAIKSLFPDADTSQFLHWYDEYGVLKVKLNRKVAKIYSLLKGGKLNDELPDTIIKALGADYETMLRKNDKLINDLNEKNKKIRDLNNVIDGLNEFIEKGEKDMKKYVEIDREDLRTIILKEQKTIEEIQGDLDLAEERKVLAKTEVEKLKVELNQTKNELEKYKNGQSNLTILESANERLQAEVDNFRELARKSIIYNQEQIAEIESQNEEILKNLPLRERVKAIFKKYGFTVFAVVSAVGVVIGVIVSNLSKGLSTLGKGVGNGLKALGKKLGEILPGMVGAIVSFLFKTAGEVISFLGKNSWLLIMAVVLYFVESVKKRK